MKKPDFKTIPPSPGVYLFKDKVGKVLYVGKAKNLKKRLANYFQRVSGLAGKQVSEKTRALMERVYNIETIAVVNELEALLLENELIKKHRPQFNIIMRDDKSYLYIQITVNEEFPRILLARKVVKDGAKYFGPYASSGPVYEILKLVKRVFPLCSSERPYSAKATKDLRPCLNYHLKICPGVCIGKVDSKTYHKTIEQVIQFLNGNYQPVIKRLKIQMAELSAKKEFERAAKVRDGLRAIEAISERQSVVKANLSVSEDAVGVARELNKAMVVLSQIRFGKLLNQQQYMIDSKYDTKDKETLSGFLRDYYSQAVDFPKFILLPEAIDDTDLLEKWLSKLANRRVEVAVPTKGRQKAVVRLTQSNAVIKFQQISGRWKLEKLVSTEGVEKLKNILHLKKLERIEAYDISNLQGTDSVGAMVVWEKGRLDKKQYRRFRVKTVTGPNDFASLAEVLQRRFQHKAGDAKFVRLPDLILIDGGKGQVGTVARALKHFRVAVIGMAKGSHSRTKAKAAPRTRRGSGDDLVLPDGRIEVLQDNSPTKILLQNIRDEAHRFAITYHTSLRKKRTTTSAMEKISGVGPVTRKKLIKAFGSMAAVKRANASEIAKIVGDTMAKRLKAQL